MTPTRITLALTSVAALAVMAVSHAAQPAAPQKPNAKAALQKFMRAKLSASNKIIEGLVTEDYRMIAAGAKTLGEISDDEKWRISTDVMYRQHSQEFRRMVDQLQESAEKENLDGAALTWIAATMSCIECHKHVRAILIANPGAGVSDRSR